MYNLHAAIAGWLNASWFTEKSSWCRNEHVFQVVNQVESTLSYVGTYFSFITGRVIIGDEPCGKNPNIKLKMNKPCII